MVFHGCTCGYKKLSKFFFFVVIDIYEFVFAHGP
jgi:hypothetical protein